MSHFRLLGAVAILATAIASPVLAQAVVSEPGYCAQFYPNANCQNKGYGNPYVGYSGYYQRGMDPTRDGRVHRRRGEPLRPVSLLRPGVRHLYRPQWPARRVPVTATI